MTIHIKNRIEEIIFKGGFVNENLKNFINELSEIRHPKSIEREFEQSLKDIESRKGQIHPTSKEAILNAIELVWSNYPKGEKELYKTGTTTQIENGIKVTKYYIEA
tara:strand:- start:17 stop:334 length:318 start_codon:yes stop_codon:yes gene_type:complete